MFAPYDEFARGVKLGTAEAGKVVEVKPVLITRGALERNKTVQDLDKKLPGFGISDLATASWLTAPVEKTQ